MEWLEVVDLGLESFIAAVRWPAYDGYSGGFCLVRAQRLHPLLTAWPGKLSGSLELRRDPRR